MIRLEIINLFPKQYRPQILAYEFYYVQVVREAWPIARESIPIPSLAQPSLISREKVEEL